MKKIIFIILLLLIKIGLFAQPLNNLRMVAEWEKSVGTLIRWPLGIPYLLVRELAEDDKLFVLVADSNEENEAIADFDSHNVDLSNCEFIIATTNSHWTRDWGPHNAFDEENNWVIIDPLFDGYPWVNGDTRDYDDDDVVNSVLGNYFDCEVVELDAFLTGGNFMTDGQKNGFATQQMVDENLSLWSETEFLDLMQDTAGIDNFHITNNIETYGIQHIDCGAKLLDEETVLIKRLPENHPDYARLENLADYFSNIETCFNRPFRIIRIDSERYEGNACAAYTNSLILNKKVLVPLYGIPADEDALQTYENAMPGYEVIGIQYYLWYDYDAIHCRTREIIDRNQIFVTHRNPDYELTEAADVELVCRIEAMSGEELISDSLKVFWKTSEETEFNSLQLQPTATENVFSATILQQESGAEIQYYLSAADYSGQKTTKPITAPHKLFKFLFDYTANSDESLEVVINSCNYPNPFNPQTTIYFNDLIKSDTLQIYDIKGRLVAEIMVSNVRQTIWNAKDESGNELSSGIYLYRLKSSPTNQGKMVLVK